MRFEQRPPLPSAFEGGKLKGGSLTQIKQEFTCYKDVTRYE